MLVTLDTIRKMYPRRKGTAGVTGYIPMDVFNAVEKELRKDMRVFKLRAIYRGPRTNPSSSMTRRADATHAVLYFTS